MRRSTLLLLGMVAAMIMTTGVALAATFLGNDKNNVVRGDPGNDELNIHEKTKRYGTDGSDAVYGRPGNDYLYGGCGNDNFKNIAGYDRYGNPITAGLRGNMGDDVIYGQRGDDDLSGHGGTDTLDDVNNAPDTPDNKGEVSCSSATTLASDWDRAFGGTGADKVNVADGDTRDEVSCGEEDPASPAGDDDTVADTVVIDVVKGDSVNPDKITAADTVYELDANKNSTECELIKDKDGNRIFQDQLPPSTSVTAAVEPTSTVPS